MLPGPDSVYPLDDPLLEELARQLSLKEEEPARLEVTYSLHLEQRTQIVARTLEQAGRSAEHKYEKSDFAAGEIEHEHWKPLNPAAKRLLDQRAREENRQRLSQLRSKLAQLQRRQTSSDVPPDVLKDRVLSLLYRQIIGFNMLMEKQSQQERNYREDVELKEEANRIEATLAVLCEVLRIPRLSMWWALAVIRDHYSPSPQLPAESYQQIVAWWSAPQPSAFLDVLTNIQ